jgi:tryptophanase
MAALAVGLNEATEFAYLESRISQVEYLGNKLIEYGIPVQKPIGGHAVFIDSLNFLPNVSREEYPAQTLGLEIYKEAGIRTVEIGTLLADRDPKPEKTVILNWNWYVWQFREERIPIIIWIILLQQ